MIKINKKENGVLLKIFEKMGRVESRLEDMPIIKEKIDELMTATTELKIGFSNHLHSHSKSSKFYRWLIGILVTLITSSLIFIKLKFNGG